MSCGDSFSNVSGIQKDYFKAIDCIKEIQHDVVHFGLKNCKPEEKDEMNKQIGDMMCSLYKVQEEFTKIFERRIAEDSCIEMVNNENDSCTNQNESPEKENLIPEPGYTYSPQVFSENTRLKTVKNRSIKNLIKIIEIEPLNEVEYKLVPKYMLGRFSLDNINKFIETINTAISVKYSILSTTRSNLKPKEYNQYLEYKKYETSEVAGKTFVLEQDITGVQNRKNFDKSSTRIIVILRHTKRITEVRAGSLTKYVIN